MERVNQNDIDLFNRVSILKNFSDVSKYDFINLLSLHNKLYGDKDISKWCGGENIGQYVSFLLSEILNYNKGGFKTETTLPKTGLSTSYLLSFIENFERLNEA